MPVNASDILKAAGTDKKSDEPNAQDILEAAGVSKKKENSPASPSVSSHTTTSPATSATPSASNVDLHDNIFGTTVKQKKPVGGVNISVSDLKKNQKTEEDAKQQKEQSDFANKEGKDLNELIHSDKFSISAEGELTENAAKEAKAHATVAQKEEIEQQQAAFNQAALNGTLTGDQIDLLRGGIPKGKNDFQSGLSNDQIAEALNAKTKNIRAWRDAAVNKGAENYLKQNQQLGLQIDAADKAFDFKTADELKTRQAFLKSGLTKMYETEKSSMLPKLMDNLRWTQYGDNSWEDVFNGKTKKGMVQYDPTTHQLTRESAADVLGWVNGYVGAQNSKVINAEALGRLSSEGHADYPDIGRTVLDYLNTVVQANAARGKNAEEFLDKNPQWRPYYEHQQQLANYFTPERNEAAKQYADKQTGKDFTILKEKYWGRDGTITTHPAFVKIQHQFAEAVAKGEMPDDIAKKNIMTSVENSPELKQMLAAEDKEIASLNDKRRGYAAKYLTNGLRATVDPNLTVLDDGTIAPKGVGPGEAEVKRQEYVSGMVNSVGTSLRESAKAMMDYANMKARTLGAFQGSLEESTHNTLGALYSWLYSKTGYGGDEAMYYKAKDYSEIPVSQAEEAAGWKWEGATSLMNPKFYASSVAKAIPIVVPAVAVGAATGGAGLTEEIGWLGAAGVTTFQDATQTFHDISGQRDVNGNIIDEWDAGNIAAKQAKEEFLPNLAAMSLNLGMLSRGKALAKPGIIGGLKESALSAISGAPPMLVQGYLSYANEKQARGESADFWDFMQDGTFAATMANALSVGVGLQVAHAPFEAARSIRKWHSLVGSAKGELVANSLFNFGLQNEIDGKGQTSIDALKLQLFNKDYQNDAEKADLENSLKYATALRSNIQGGNINVKDINGAYQAHNLALADMHDYLAQKNEGNSNLAKIYEEQAKEYRKKAADAIAGKAKYHYLIDSEGKPIFISDEGFKILDQEGSIGDYMNQGLIKDVVKSDDPEFSAKYKEQMTKSRDEKEQAVLQEKNQGEVQRTQIEDERNKELQKTNSLRGTLNFVDDKTLAGKNIEVEGVKMKAADYQNDLKDEYNIIKQLIPCVG